jgi:hypothetical protein
MDAADRERPSTPSPATTTPNEFEPETTEATEEPLALLAPENDPACESGYGFGV